MTNLWIIERDVFGDEVELAKAVANNGDVPFLADRKDFENLISISDLPVNIPDFPVSNIRVRGSISFISSLRKFPGLKSVLYTFENYKCCHYYRHFKGHLLNENYVLLPVANRESVNLLAWKRVFVRPNAGGKMFAGFVYDFRPRKIWDELAYVDQDALMLVAEAQQLTAEWRVFMREDKPVDCSQYAGLPSIPHAHRDSIIERAYELGRLFQPDDFWSMDIAETPNGLKLIEINSFNCSAMYGCDKEKLVKAYA